MDNNFEYDIKKAKEIGAQAMTRLADERLPATPDMYELFYCYYGDLHSEVVRSIDIMVAQNFELTLDRCCELHRRLLNSDRSRETLEKAEKIVDNTLSDVDIMMDDMRSSNTEFSGSMDRINTDLTDAVDADQLKNLVSSMMAETQKMVAENLSLEKKLEKSSSTMQSLKAEMEEVRVEAYTDSLTRIPNRKRFNVEVIRLMAEARNENKPLSIIFMDIDHFKSFNDTYGHQIGDQVLRLVAKCFGDGLKGRDFACRYGGEEFVILLPETDIKGAEKIANILREAIKAKEIKNKITGETLTRISVSAGVSQLYQDEAVEKWVDRADRALYQAKRKGRDRVEVAALPEYQKNRDA